MADFKDYSGKVYTLGPKEGEAQTFIDADGGKFINIGGAHLVGTEFEQFSQPKLYDAFVPLSDYQSAEKSGGSAVRRLLYDNTFQKFAGRKLTDAEYNGWARGITEKPFEAVLGYAENLQGMSKDITDYADASGLKLTPEEANAIRDKYATSKGPMSPDDREKAMGLAIGSLTGKIIDDSVKRAKDPASALNPDEQSANRIKAGDILKRTFSDVMPDYAPTEDDIDFVSDMLASGDRPYEIVSTLRAVDDRYIGAKNKIENDRIKGEMTAARDELDTKLQASGDEVFKRATPGIIASYMRAGRLGSSGLDNALARARAEIDRDRQTFIMNADYDSAIRREGYNREDLVNRNVGAFNNYMRSSEPGYQAKFAASNAGSYAAFQRPYDAMARFYGTQDRDYGRRIELENYNLEQSDYGRQMMASRKAGRQNMPFQLAGNLLGAGLQGWAMGGFKNPFAKPANG